MRRHWCYCCRLCCFGPALRKEETGITHTLARMSRKLCLLSGVSGWRCNHTSWPPADMIYLFLGQFLQKPVTTSPGSSTRFWAKVTLPPSPKSAFAEGSRMLLAMISLRRRSVSGIFSHGHIHTMEERRVVEVLVEPYANDSSLP